MITFTYILSYDPLAENVTHNQLLAFVRSSRHIRQYYQPFVGTYVLKSEEGIVPLTESFRGIFDGSTFVITLATPAMMSGALPPAIWEWVNSGTLPALTGSVTS